MKRIILILTAITALSMGLASTAQAAPIIECGTYNPYANHWTSTTHPDFSGYTPVYNLTTRNVRCSDARPASLNIMRHHSPPFGSHRNTYYHSFTCRWQWFYGEDWDVRCTRGSQVIHWQGGA
jgi:hypothetical protein